MIIARATVRRSVLGVIAAGVLAGVATAIVVLPSAKGEPTTTPSPTPTTTASPEPSTTASPTPTTTPTTTASPTPTTTVSPAARPAAAANPCTASNLTATISKVNLDISQYLLAHPDTNQALADVAKQSPFAAQSAFNSYFDGNQTAKADLHALQQPLIALSDQCGFQVTPGQVLTAMGDL